jgi:hypothetical protein
MATGHPISMLIYLIVKKQIPFNWTVIWGKTPRKDNTTFVALKVSSRMNTPGLRTLKGAQKYHSNGSLQRLAYSWKTNGTIWKKILVLRTLIQDFEAGLTLSI